MDKVKTIRDCTVFSHLTGCSSDESPWSDYGLSPSANHRSLTPFAFRADRYKSDVSKSDSETDPEFEAHKQLLYV